MTAATYVLEGLEDHGICAKAVLGETFDVGLIQFRVCVHSDGHSVTSIGAPPRMPTRAVRDAIRRAQPRVAEICARAIRVLEARVARASSVDEPGRGPGSSGSAS